jgi:hypothetical protein
VRSVQDKVMSSSASKNIINVLQQGCEDLLADDIPPVVESVYHPLVTGGSTDPTLSGALMAFELLPQLVNVISKKNSELICEHKTRTDVSGMNGQDYVEHVVMVK